MVCVACFPQGFPEFGLYASISEDMSASWAMFLLPADSLLEYPERLEKFRDEGMVFAEGLSIP